MATILIPPPAVAPPAQAEPSSTPPSPSGPSYIRKPCAAAKDGLCLPAFGRVNRHGVPWVGIVASTVVTLHLPTGVDDATSEALALRAAGAVREIDHWTPVVDVTIERGGRP